MGRWGGAAGEVRIRLPAEPRGPLDGRPPAVQGPCSPGQTMPDRWRLRLRQRRHGRRARSIRWLGSAFCSARLRRQGSGSASSPRASGRP